MRVMAHVRPMSRTTSSPRAQTERMNILVLTRADVERLLPMAECIPVMAAALAALDRGQAYQPLRTLVQPPGAAGILVVMPSYLAAPGGRPAYGIKAVGVFPDNPA